MITATGLLLCNLLYENERHNFTLLDVFTDLVSPIFPTNPKSIYGYVMLIGNPGEVGEAVWELHDQETGLVYFHEVQRIQLGLNGKRHVRMDFLDVRFRHPGDYHFTLAVEGNVVTGQTLTVKRM